MKQKIYITYTSFTYCKNFMNTLACRILLPATPSTNDKANGRLAQLLSTLLSLREVWGSIPGPVKFDTVSPTARHRCDVFLELCHPGAKPRRWTPPLVTRFGIIPRVWGRFFVVIKNLTFYAKYIHFQQDISQQIENHQKHFVC